LINKNKIFTITPNPALDISGVVEHIIPDEKNYVHDEFRSPGGNAINVSRILNRLGVPCLASGFLGGATGEEIASLLSTEKIHHRFIKIKGSTRMNVTVSNKSNHKQTRLSFPGPYIAREEKEQLFKLVKNISGVEMLVIGGSLPPQFSVIDLRKMILAAQERNIAVVVDCPGTILEQLKIPRLLLIKPNLEEFQGFTKSRARSISEVKKQALPLLKRVSYICVSSVEGGALLMTQTDRFFGKIAPITVRSTVGAGDSMVGAMVAQLYERNPSAADILRWGLAAAAATLGEIGTTLGSASQIKRLYKQTVVEKV
jgi:1-phosphofructokinase family hexose kinase